MSFRIQNNSMLISYQHWIESYSNFNRRYFVRYHYESCSCCGILNIFQEDVPFSLHYTSGKNQQQQRIQSFQCMRVILHYYGCPLDIKYLIVFFWIKLFGGYRPHQCDYKVYYVRKLEECFDYVVHFTLQFYFILLYIPKN